MLVSLDTYTLIKNLNNSGAKRLFSDAELTEDFVEQIFFKSFP
jgi:hypothetical protein